MMTNEEATTLKQMQAMFPLIDSISYISSSALFNILGPTILRSMRRNKGKQNAVVDYLVKTTAKIENDNNQRQSRKDIEKFVSELVSIQINCIATPK
jgi:hypothetical protein